MIVKTRCIIAVAAAVVCCTDVFSQEWSAGIFNSPKGFGISFCDRSEERSFFNAYNLYADMYGVIRGKYDTPGVKFDFCHDIIIKEVPAGTANCLFYAGPGVSVGFLRDYNSETYGFMFALNGSCGARFLFSRGLAMDIGLGAELGIDIGRKGKYSEATVISLYKNGLFRFIYPQFRIEYSFK